MAKLSAEQAKKVLSYDPETGVLNWKCSLARRVKAGDVAGSDDGQGYLQICIYGTRYKAHRLAWLIMTGGWPDGEIDHINGNRKGNNWANLREVTRQENCCNKATQRNNNSGATGVYWNGTKQKWMAQINIGRVRHRLGSYSSIGEATKARKAAEKEHGFHKNHGRK